MKKLYKVLFIVDSKDEESVFQSEIEDALCSVGFEVSPIDCSNEKDIYTVFEVTR